MGIVCSSKESRHGTTVDFLFDRNRTRDEQRIDGFHKIYKYHKRTLLGFKVVPGDSDQYYLS